jgi:hypothetical protein
MFQRIKNLFTGARATRDFTVARAVRKGDHKGANGFWNSFSSSLRTIKGRVTVLQTYGGFTRVYDDLSDLQSGTRSGKQDFDAAVAIAAKAVGEKLPEERMALIREKADILTLGIDVYDNGEGTLASTHAELVATIDTQTNRILSWTGKSQPLAQQATTLVYCTDLDSHFQLIANTPTLVLGCHDLNIFSNRSRASTRRGSYKAKVIDRMQELVDLHRPRVVLAHPHTTDTWKVWSVAFSGLQEHIPSAELISIGFDYFNPAGSRRATLEETLARTSLGRVTDVVF